MDRRTKILVGAFAVLVGAGLVRGVVYPTWIHPLLTIDERIVERRKVLDVLEAQEAAVQQARHEYKALVARVGSFDVGKVETEVRDLQRRPLAAGELDRFDAVVFDPPRAGAEAQARALAGCHVPRIAAVSCNPATFARDAAILINGGYRLIRVCPVDQFKWSPHVEIVGLFQRG